MARPRRGGRGRRRSALVLASSLALASCGGGGHTPTGAGTPQPSGAGSTRGPVGAAPAGTPTWIFTRQALQQVLSAPSSRSALSGGRVLEILRGQQQPSGEVPTVPIMSFSSLVALEQALSTGLPPYVRGIMYDSEVWPLTPVAEQQDPKGSYTRAAALAHARHLLLVAAPAMNLATARGAVADRSAAFLSQGIGAAAARGADVLDVQAQSLERDPGRYAAYVQAVSRQATASHPGITVVSGLSTNPPGALVTAKALLAAVQATRQVVAGYWVNIPGQGAQCPTCGPPQPQLAVQLLAEPLWRS